MKISVYWILFIFNFQFQLFSRQYPLFCSHKLIKYIDIMKRPTIIIDKKNYNHKSPDDLRIDRIKEEPQFSFTKQQHGSSALEQNNILEISEVLQTQELNEFGKQKFTILQVQKQAKFQIIELFRLSPHYKQMARNLQFKEDIQSILNLQALNLSEVFENFIQIMKKIILFSVDNQKQKVILLSRNQRTKLKITQNSPNPSKKDKRIQQQNKKIKMQNFRIKQANHQLQIQIVKISQLFKKKKERYKAEIQKLTDILKCSFMEAGKKFIQQQLISQNEQYKKKIGIDKNEKQYKYLVQNQGSQIDEPAQTQNREFLDFNDYNINVLKTRKEVQENTARSQVIQMKRVQSERQPELIKKTFANPLRSTQSNIFLNRKASQKNNFNSADKTKGQIGSKLEENQSNKNSLKTMRISNSKSQEQFIKRLGSPKIGKVYASQIDPFK